MNSITEVSADPDEEQVRQRAYCLWQEAGCQDGRQDEYWYAAQRRLQAERATPAEPADPHPSDEDAPNVYNPSPGGASIVEGRDGDLDADPDNRGSPA